MDLSFAERDSADASFLAKELELLLQRNGIPQNAMALKRSSPENMDLGSILSVNLDAVAHALGGLGYIACFANCIYEIVTKHNSTIVIVTEHGTSKFPASKIDPEIIANALQVSLAKPRDDVAGPERS
ncbi:MULTISPECIES: hypothetical protein [Rhodopseudomonas]|uniref:Uncharacterized protein n=1 Tax=Rhodopseudomonas palustris TaxID=1076 RepID=A0A0D7ETB6_RHOPL|nr:MULTISPECIES: hypothetical protein [Rhodopseudomonas]KIZ44038.1 hypothetical protein OO17_10330 [Rhodopseudomonas palustris]MDF3809312.1 hypothetical protein [Rhodopseudomonas sp. BAL398]WOK19007.1 hypothetical protein RBJ75_05665 [Rhodopseudomonas sp. BAL398]